MTPNIDERLASLIRSLGQVVLPHLPPEASLAQEQVHLALGHLQILRAQIDSAPAFEAEEAAGAAGHARALADLGGPGAPALAATLADGATDHPRERVTALHDAIDHYIAAAWTDGDSAHRAAVTELVLAYEDVRVQKDRAWCAPFGFDRA